MKRYLIHLTALSLLALATGCQKEEGEINNPQNNQSAAVNISIDGLSIDAASSRAVIVDMPDFSKNGFKIAGYYTKGTAPVPPDVPGTSGLFDDNITTATPNVFDYNGTVGESVIVPTLKDGKYHVKLSQWALLENSYLSYFAWASNVDAGVAEGAAENPIKSSTKHGDMGAPAIWVTSGSANASLNVDVVAAKSADNSNDVVRSAIDLNFKHVMTKLKFNVKNSSRVDITLTGAKILFEAGKVYRNAKYSFDGKLSPLGTWGTYTDNEAATYPVTLTNTNLIAMGAAVPLEELLIIPQASADGAISVELTYTIPNGATPLTYTSTVPLKARTYEQNTSYTYEITLNETAISINDGRIGAWIETSTGDLPYIAGARDPNVQLLLDAYDAPYTHTDGTQYWLDRSGWNRHCKLVGSGVTYNAAEKCYSFAGSAEYYIEVPAFSATTAATIDVIARSRRPDGQTASQNLFWFVDLSSGQRRIMFTHFGYQGSTNLYFDAGQTSAVGYTRVHGNIPLDLLKKYAMYSFSKDLTGQAVYRNLIYQNNDRDPYQAPHSKVDLSTATIRRFGNEFMGDIKYIKVSNVAKPQITKTEYADLAKRHKIPDSECIHGYSQDGLVLDLQAVNAPEGGLWKDLSGSGAHAKLVGAVVYDAAAKEYRTKLSSGGYLEIQLPASFKQNGYFNSHTLEIVYYVPKIGGALPAERHNHFIALDGSGNRSIFFHSGYDSGFAINYQAPLNWSSGSMQVSKTYNDGGAMCGRRTSYYAGRSMGGGVSYIEARANNVFVGKVDASFEFSLGAITQIRIGENPMHISAVRLYNKWTSDVQNLSNVNVDKKNYGF